MKEAAAAGAAVASARRQSVDLISWRDASSERHTGCVIEEPLELRRGRLLASWREEHGVRQVTVAERLGVSKTTVSNWETGRRARNASSLRDIESFAAVIRASALPRLWSAISSTRALSPRTEWMHNYTMPADPAWVWLRPGPRAPRLPESEPDNSVPDHFELAASLRWGALTGTCRSVVGAGGIIITFPTSIPNPPLQVRLTDPGWADFGQGTIPPVVAATLDAQLVDARSLIEPNEPAVPPLDHSDTAVWPHLNPLLREMRSWAETFSVSWTFIRPHLGLYRPSSPTYALDSDELAVNPSAGPAITDIRGALVSQLLLSPTQLLALRKARGYSQQELATAVTKQDPLRPVSAGMIAQLEGCGHIADVPTLLSRLDTVLNCDGRLGLERCCEPTPSSAANRDGRNNGRPRNGVLVGITTVAVHFPAAWRGPVWLQVQGPDPAVDQPVSLEWGMWRRRQRLRPGTVMTTRKGLAVDEELRITLPPLWWVTAGTGAVPTAININDGWQPVSVRAAARFLATGMKALRDRSRANPDMPVGTSE